MIGPLRILAALVADEAPANGALTGIMQHVVLRMVCEAACRVVDQVTHGLGVREETTITDPSGVHIALPVLCLDDCSAGQRFESATTTRTENAATALIADPEVMLLRTSSGLWRPLSLRTPHVVVTGDVGDTVQPLRPGAHEQLVKIVDEWMANVSTSLIGSGVLAEEMQRATTYVAE